MEHRPHAPLRDNYQQAIKAREYSIEQYATASTQYSNLEIGPKDMFQAIKTHSQDSGSMYPKVIPPKPRLHHQTTEQRLDKVQSFRLSSNIPHLLSTEEKNNRIKTAYDKFVDDKITIKDLARKRELYDDNYPKLLPPWEASSLQLSPPSIFLSRNSPPFPNAPILERQQNQKRLKNLEAIYIRRKDVILDLTKGNSDPKTFDDNITTLETEENKLNASYRRFTKKVLRVQKWGEKHERRPLTRFQAPKQSFETDDHPLFPESQALIDLPLTPGHSILPTAIASRQEDKPLPDYSAAFLAIARASGDLDRQESSPPSRLRTWAKSHDLPFFR